MGWFDHCCVFGTIYCVCLCAFFSVGSGIIVVETVIYLRINLNHLSVGLRAQVGWLVLGVDSHLTLSLHSSNELGRLSQGFCRDCKRGCYN